MTPSESQQLLSRLYTDRAYREEFLAGKEAFYKNQQITDPETLLFLNALKPEQIAFFSKGLYTKRYHEVLRLIPGTAWLLNERIGPLFRRFSEVPQKYGIHKHHEEALAFLQFIRIDQKHSTWMKAIFKFEETLIANFVSPKKWKFVCFSINPVLFLKQLQLGESPHVKKTFTLIVFKQGKIYKIF